MVTRICNVSVINFLHFPSEFFSVDIAE
jgi:hypothetical protein